MKVLRNLFIATLTSLTLMGAAQAQCWECCSSAEATTWQASPAYTNQGTEYLMDFSDQDAMQMIQALMLLQLMAEQNNGVQVQPMFTEASWEQPQPQVTYPTTDFPQQHNTRGGAGEVPSSREGFGGPRF